MISVPPLVIRSVSDNFLLEVRFLNLNIVLTSTKNFKNVLTEKGSRFFSVSVIIVNIAVDNHFLIAPARA